MIEYVWHHNHDRLLSRLLRPYAARLEEIARKPAGEQALRRRLYQRIRGPLPLAACAAGQASEEAKRAREEAWQAWVEANRAREEAWQAWVEADRAWEEADRAWEEAKRAWEEAVAASMPAILALHAAECPDCPWDGRTIFPA